MTKYSKLSGEKSTPSPPPQDSLFCMPPWGPLPPWKLSVVSGTQDSRLFHLQAIGQCPFRLLLYPDSNMGVSEAQRLAKEPHSSTISLSLFPLTLALHLSYFPRHSASSPATHKLIHSHTLNTIHTTSINPSVLWKPDAYSQLST